MMRELTLPLTLILMLIGSWSGTVIPAFATCPVSTDSCKVRSLTDDSTTVLTDCPVRSNTPTLRFAQISDAHILDDDGQILNGLSPLDPVHPILESAQRFQDEYTDEVLNAMLGSINACHDSQNNPIEFMISTGDNVDLGTVAELRRFIDNIDGQVDQLSAFEEKCRASLPAATPEAVLDLLCTRFTGKGLPDTQTVDPNPDDLTYQLLYTRMPRQLLDTETAVLTGRDENGDTHPDLQTATRAPGLPRTLRCELGAPECEKNALSPTIPWYAVFGNHDGTARGTVTYEPGVQEISLATGRHYMQQQHEFIDEFFKTSSQPVGHGFEQVPFPRMNDGDPRNDGYYALDWLNSSGKTFRLIVLNTLIDGVDGELLGIDAAAVGPVNVRNPLALDSGAIDANQFEWLKTELTNAELDGKLVLVFSHHPDLSFSELGTFGFAVPGHVTAAELDGALASHPNVIAWIAGHTHRNRIRAFKVTNNNSGTNGAITAPVHCSDNKTCLGFWEIETSSLIDTPQEARIIEVFDNHESTPPHTGVLRLSLIEHSLPNPKRLAERDDRCQFYLTDPAAVQSLITEADLSVLCSQGGTRPGNPEDRNVDLVFAMP